MGLKKKVELLRQYGNEIALGYNDSGCFWSLCYGPRGAGSMMREVGALWLVSDADDFEEAVDWFLAQLERRHGKRDLS